jgi:hypothetical protein
MFVGSGAKLVSTLSKIAPKATERLVRKKVIPGTHSGRPRTGRDALHEPGGGLRERGDYAGRARPSVYTKMTIHPRIAAAFGISAAVLLTAVWRART